MVNLNQRHFEAGRKYGTCVNLNQRRTNLIFAFLYWNHIPTFIEMWQMNLADLLRES